MIERIIVKNLWKKFNIGVNSEQSILGRIISFLSGKEQRKEFSVLKDISFTAKSGEIIGIIGRNGAGKSTLLRVIAGIYPKDDGKIIINGKLVSVIGMDTGLDLRLSMRDNIFLCCSILGLNPQEIKKKFNEIVKFTGLESFVDTKLYQFSSGMLSRLTFSIIVHSVASNPDILLLDEIFEVGDQDFKKKCEDKIRELTKQGAAVFITGHNEEILSKLCSRFIWIEKGKMIGDGNKKILENYQDSFLKKEINQKIVECYRRYKEKYKIKKLHIYHHCDNELDSWLNLNEYLNKPEFLFHFANSEFQYIFLEHVIQHLSHEEGLKFLRECFRILEPGGKIRIMTYDLENLMKIYESNKKIHKEYIKWNNDLFFKREKSSDAFMINDYFNGGYQKFTYDFKTIKSSLEKAGFSNIKRVEIMESTDKNFKGLEEDGKKVRKEFTDMDRLIIEASK